MCQKLQILEHNDHGYVAHCAGCDGFTLAFGTLLVVLLENDLRETGRMLETLLGKHRNRVCPNAKMFMIRAGSDRTVQFILTYREMEQLSDMITPALLVHEAKNLVDTSHD